MVSSINPCATASWHYSVEQWAPIQTDLYKLLLYEEGCYFRRHRDNERMPGCFGTLVIQLPSVGRCRLILGFLQLPPRLLSGTSSA